MAGTYGDVDRKIFADAPAHRGFRFRPALGHVCLCVCLQHMTKPNPLQQLAHRDRFKRLRTTKFRKGPAAMQALFSFVCAMPCRLRWADPEGPGGTAQARRPHAH
ncbi:hypothetical protein OF001_U80011 [Pseudomonas sp. OF001]|nr:hypothetical protein OF001_U80011 [Pseudomonas sp. OF001]